MVNNSEEKIICKLKIIFEKLLDVKIKNFEQLVFGETKNWDSLKHLNLIINIEKEFLIRIKTADVTKLNTFNKIKDYIISRKNVI